jgi:hypothetical protein
VALDKFMSHGQRRNDVSAGAAAGDEYAQVRQMQAFQKRHGISLFELFKTTKPHSA